MIVDDVMNKLSDMSTLTLPVYGMQFPDDVINCVTIFIGTSGGVGSRIGYVPSAYTNTAQTLDHIDYPGVQIQVRYTDPYNAFKEAEAIRTWLDGNVPTGYVRCDTKRSQPVDLTSADDLARVGGPCYRYSVDFAFTRVR
jgi:hypothetical protein